MTTVLVERSFEVPVTVEAAWSALADLEQWPTWAPHIAEVRASPAGPLTADTSGSLRFRPAGRSRFAMTAFDPPHSWTWSGRALGVLIDYEHRFEAVAPRRTRMVWRVVSPGGSGPRARLFAAVYARLVDRAWPRFQASLEAGAAR